MEAPKLDGVRSSNVCNLRINPYTPLKTNMTLEKSPFSIGNTSSNGGFSLVMWVFRRVHFNETAIQQTEPSSHTSRLAHRSPSFRVPMTHKPDQQHWGTPVTHSIAIPKPFLPVRHLRRRNLEPVLRKPSISPQQRIGGSHENQGQRELTSKACLLALGLSADWFLVKFSGRVVQCLWWDHDFLLLPNCV